GQRQTNNSGEGTGGGAHYKGLIDEVRIWNVARAQGQIAADMNRRLAGSESGLVAYYQFDEQAGATTITDSSGNGHVGTLGGGVAGQSPSFVLDVPPVAGSVNALV